MDRIAALNLAQRVRQHWSHVHWKSADEDAWVDMLEQLDEGQAGTAVLRYIAANPERPSPATFLGLHRSLNTHNAIREDCSHCGGDGLASVHRDDCPGRDHADCTCNAMTWCRHCRTGEARRKTIEAIVSR